MQPAPPNRTTPPGMVSRVLLLGDGNFSFAHALAQRLNSSPNLRADVIATSFDSHEEVVAKYPEAASTLKKLTRFPNFSVMHEVDATHISDHFPGQRFEEIWFNFPHLGREDLQSHIALVAHYFHSAQSCLADGGFVCLALSEEQQRIWEIRNSAARLGLECACSLPLHAEQWPGYHLKRHHTGRSFATRVQDLHHYCFRAASREGPGAVCLLEALSDAPPTTLEVAAVATAAVAPAPVPTPAEKKEKRKRVHVLVDGRFSAADGQFVCLDCKRAFPTEQGARTHVYNVHVLGSDKKATPTEGSTQCPHCAKPCADADSLRQHIVAKHTGTHTHILPYWKAPAPPSSSSPPRASATSTAADSSGATLEHDCAVCGWRFPTPEALQCHKVAGFAPQGETEDFQCTCGKRFGQKRAWMQHANFCDRAACT